MTKEELWRARRRSSRRRFKASALSSGSALFRSSPHTQRWPLLTGMCERIQVCRMAIGGTAAGVFLVWLAYLYLAIMIQRRQHRARRLANRYWMIFTSSLVDSSSIAALPQEGWYAFRCPDRVEYDCHVSDPSAHRGRDVQMLFGLAYALRVCSTPHAGHLASPARASVSARDRRDCRPKMVAG